MAQFEALRASCRMATGRGGARGGDGRIRGERTAASARRGLSLYRLAQLLREAAPLAHCPSTKAGRSVEAGRFMGDLGAHEIIFVNGRWMDGSSLASKLPPGVTIRTSADTAAAILDPDDAVVALNTALARETVTLEIADGVDGRAPLHFAFVQDAAAPQACSRGFALSVGKRASVTLLETHEGPDASRRNRMSTSRSRSATARASSMCGSMREGDKALSLSSLGLSLGRGASALSLSFTLGRRFASPDPRSL